MVCYDEESQVKVHFFFAYLSAINIVIILFCYQQTNLCSSFLYIEAVVLSKYIFIHNAVVSFLIFFNHITLRKAVKLPRLMVTECGGTRKKSETLGRVED